MAQIRIDCANARRQARKLDNAARDCDEVVRRLQSEVNTLTDGWTGEAANAYITELQQRITEIRKIGVDARDMAYLLRKAAEEFEEAEKEMKSQM